MWNRELQIKKSGVDGRVQNRTSCKQGLTRFFGGTTKLSSLQISRKTSENVVWESSQTKFFDILDVFVVQHLFAQEMISTIALHVLLAS